MSVEPFGLNHSRDVRSMARSLAAAFFDDPVAAWLFPTAATRDHDLRAFFETQLRHGYLPRGEVVATDDVSTVAMWMPSWTKPLDVVDRLAHLRVPLLMRSRFSPARELTKTLTAQHPRVPHYYLGTIGTVPEARKRGQASACMEALRVRCERDKVGAYLECSNEDNVPFYRHHGYGIQQTVTAPADGPMLWLMWSPPPKPGETY